MQAQSLRVQSTNPVHVASPVTHPLHGVRVLVVDDEVDMRELVMTLLEQAGAIVEMAGSADEALAVFEQFQPMVLVSDIGMPETDGYELMRQVESRFFKLGRRIPAIALSAYAREQDQQQALNAGFQLHIAKPIEPEILVKEIAALVSRG
jgi:CheY-like chemotaxis protein